MGADLVHGALFADRQAILESLTPQTIRTPDFPVKSK